MHGHGKRRETCNPNLNHFSFQVVSRNMLTLSRTDSHHNVYKWWFFMRESFVFGVIRAEGRARATLSDGSDHVLSA